MTISIERVSHVQMGVGSGITYTQRAGVSVNLTALTAPSAMTWTNEGRSVFSYANTNFNGYSIYSAIFPGVASMEAVNGVVEIPLGTTVDHVSAVAGYLRNKSSGAFVGAGQGNGAALFGVATAEANNCAVWGINTLLQDAPTRAVGAATGRILACEFDFNVMCPDTQVIGLSIGGNSLAQSTNANGFFVNPLGTGFKWTTGFLTQDGAAETGLALGATAASGTNVGGQPIKLVYLDGGGARQVIQLQAVGGFLSLTSGHLSVGAGYNIYLQSGQSLQVNGVNVVTSRQTGFSQMTGTALLTALATYAAGTASGAYVQAELQAVMNELQSASRRLKAHEDALFTHGLIGA